MKAYSLDLREKIVEIYQAGGITQRELAARFRVSLNFIVKLLRQLRSVGARTYEKLSEAISAAIKLITATDAQNWIRHCGYVSHLL